MKIMKDWNIFNMRKEDERTGTLQPVEEVSHRNLILGRE